MGRGRPGLATALLSGDTIAGLEDLVLAGIAEVGHDQRNFSVPVDVKKLQQISLMPALSPKRSTIKKKAEIPASL